MLVILHIQLIKIIMTKKIFFILIIIFIASCGNDQRSQNDKSHEDDILGFWDRKGTVQYVNGVAVDTLLIENSDNPDYKQIKAYVDGNILWMNNFADTVNNPWNAGMGGYGKFKIHSNDSLTEYMANGTGWFGAYLKNYKDSLNVSNETYHMSVNLTQNSYSQKTGGTNSKRAEYYEPLDDLSPKTKIDGVWKRVYRINYVNGIPVDTLSIPSDAVLDVKVMHRGRYMYQVDATGMVGDPSKAAYGGYGGYGQFDYDDNGNLAEWPEWGSGNSQGENPPRTSVIYHKVKFYNDDLFLQVGKDTLETNQSNLGLVYKRIK